MAGLRETGKGDKNYGCNFSQNKYQKISGNAGRGGEDRDSAPGGDGGALRLQSAALEFYVVRNKEKIKELSEASPYAGCAKGAPVVFVPCYRKNCQVPMYAEIDLSAAVENLLLEADSLGLGAVWMGIAPQKDRMVDVRKVLDIPGELEPFALVPCGYPAQERTQEDRYEVERVHYVD